jgi:hypothetical protein
MASGLEGEPQHAADADGGVAPLDDLMLRSQLAHGIRSGRQAVAGDGADRAPGNQSTEHSSCKQRSYVAQVMPLCNGG